MKKELIDVLDEQGKRTGAKATKREVHEKGLWHQTVHVWVFNSKGEVLLQKRAADKDYWPGYWDISAAGHLSEGETPEQAILREMEEEIGIKVKLSQLKKVCVRKESKNIPERGYHNNEFQHAYLYKFDGGAQQVKLSDGEVELVKFVPIEELERELKDTELSKKYVPHGQYYKMIIQAIRKELAKGK
jgi:isopentenyldiphosphate isomerase